jgi:hypothetical protein
MPGDERYTPFVARWILPFVRESTLWPVLLVLIGHASAFLVPVVLMGVRDRMLAPAAALLGAVGGTVSLVRYEIRCIGRPAALTGVAAATWLLAGVLAWLADRHGVF